MPRMMAGQRDLYRYAVLNNSGVVYKLTVTMRQAVFWQQYAVKAFNRPFSISSINCKVENGVRVYYF